MNGQQFFERLLHDHARLFFDEAGRELVSRLPLHFVRQAEVTSVSEPGLIVVIDAPFRPGDDPASSECMGVSVVLLSPVAPPAGFEVVETSNGALYRNSSGAVLPAWNLFGVCQHFLGFEEENTISERDDHGRLPFSRATLVRMGLDCKPIINEYLFVVLGVAKGFGSPSLLLDPRSHVLPPVLMLSHDCDQLRGNDFFTQAVRLFRVVLPLRRFSLPRVENLWWILVNWLSPRKYYFDDALAMADLERQFAFRSAFYFLNGKGGRFGARSGDAIIAEFAERCPASAEFGMHYNYKLAFDADQLARQKTSLEGMLQRPVRSGRAHYLALEPGQCLPTLEQLGIDCDESVGFIERNSFRLGYAGAFRPWLGAGEGALVEVPLSFVDINTVPSGSSDDTMRMFKSVELVGGLITLLFHPGTLHNPESRSLYGVYLSILGYCHRHAFRCYLPAEISAALATQPGATAGLNTKPHAEISKSGQ